MNPKIREGTPLGDALLKSQSNDHQRSTRKLGGQTALSNQQKRALAAKANPDAVQRLHREICGSDVYRCLECAELSALDETEYPQPVSLEMRGPLPV